MVTISRAEYEQLQQEKAQMESTRVRLEAERIKLEAEHARLEAKLATLEQEQAQVITSLTLQNEWLLEQLKLSKKKLFGRSSEQAQLVMDQLGLIMNEAEAYIFGMNSAGKAPVAVKAHERKRSLAMCWMSFRRVLPPRWWSTACRRMNGSALSAVARW